MSLATTAIYAGLCALLLIWLSFKVIGRRRELQISVLSGDDNRLAHLMRAHGNAAEFIPIFLILLAVNESMGTPWYVLHPLGLAFLIGRVLHGLHFINLREDLSWRILGMQLTIISILIAAIGAIAHGIAGQF